MPTVTKTIIVDDTTRTIPKANRDIDHDYEFNASGVNAAFPAVLQFRMNPRTPATLNLKLNGTVLLALSNADGSLRSLHEVFGAGVLVNGANELTVTVSEGSADFSDILVSHQTTI